MDGNAEDAKYWIAVYLSIDNIAKIIPQNPEAGGLADTLKTQVQAALQTVKTIVGDFYPHSRNT